MASRVQLERPTGVDEWPNIMAPKFNATGHPRSAPFALIYLCLAVGCGVDPPAAVSPAAVSRAVKLGLPSDTHVKLSQMRVVEDFDRDIAQFESVFWDPADTVSLRQLIRDSSFEGQTVLEIGTGTGLISLCCAKAGAKRIVATDINPSAIANADYNADQLGYADRIELRFVSTEDPTAYSTIGVKDQFNLIISNPPWEDGQAKGPADYAYFDEDFALLDSLLKDLKAHLKPGGRAWLAYGCAEAIRQVHRLADHYELEVTILDERSLADVDELFLPGMLLEVKPRS